MQEIFINTNKTSYTCGSDFHLHVKTNISYLHESMLPLKLKDDNCLSAGVTAGITVVTCFIITMSVVVVLGLCVWCKMRQDRGSTIDGTQEGTKQVQETIYDEPLDTAIQLRDNQAYNMVM